MGSRREKRYITENRGVFYYTRSIPSDVRHLDTRPNPIQKSLQTNNLDIAMSRRDALCDSDEKRWRSLRAVAIRNQSKEQLSIASDDLMKAFGTEAIELSPLSLPAGKAGVALHELYQKQAVEILSGPEKSMMDRFNGWLETLPDDIAENYRKIIRNADLLAESVDQFEDPSQFVAVSMGLHRQSSDKCLKMTEAISVFFDKFALGAMKGMSPSQEQNYMAPKKRAVRRFVDLVGNVPIESITRAQAVQFKDLWLDLMHRPIKGKKALSRAGALKELQDLKYIWQCFADEYKWKDRFGRVKDNPFDDLKKHFPEPPKASVHDTTEIRVTFPTGIIREKWLQGEGLSGTNEQLRRILYTLVETGCNPLEILHLTQQKICLGHSTPHILIQPTLQGAQTHRVKTNSRVRAVPLVGIAYEAIKLHEAGFPRYYDKGNSFSGAANKFLMNNGLRTSEATVYSLRHEYVARLRSNAVPQHIEYHIVGHANDLHGKYGAHPDTPDFEEKLAEMARYMELIALPFNPNVL